VQEVPILTGLESSGMSADDLKAFGAAFVLDRRIWVQRLAISLGISSVC
jgi:hypothetical protein